jgi:hypothetical protein
VHDDAGAIGDALARDVLDITLERVTPRDVDMTSRLGRDIDRARGVEHRLGARDAFGPDTGFGVVPERVLRVREPLVDG